MSIAKTAGYYAGQAWCLVNDQPVSRAIAATTSEVGEGFSAGCNAYNDVRRQEREAKMAAAQEAKASGESKDGNVEEVKEPSNAEPLQPVTV